MSTRFAVVIALAILATSEARAWNALGHKVVAEIAWRELEASTRQQIVEILRRLPGSMPISPAR